MPKQAKRLSESILNQIAGKRVFFLGKLVSSYVIVSKNQDFRFKDQNNSVRMTLFSSKSLYKSEYWIDQEIFFKTENEWINSSIPLEDIFLEMTKMKEINSIFFLADLKAEKIESPESMIAKIWNECLGPNPIPFDPVAREALIAKGCEHPELKRHIDKWQEMKRTGSKWATGEWMNEK